LPSVYVCFCHGCMRHLLIIAVKLNQDRHARMLMAQFYCRTEHSVHTKRNNVFLFISSYWGIPTGILGEPGKGADMGGNEF
jgi:hypothetical protein